jgi:hypothetical protein
MVLTLEQQQIVLQLQNWFLSEEKAICLQAKAGFGKTYTLAKYAEICKEPVTIIAPTHAALAQLRLKLNDKYCYITVAKALGQFPVQSNFSTELKFGSFGGKKLEGLVIVDEFSMLSEHEVKALLALSDKIIFSGDNNQLAPVKKKSGYSLLMALPQLALTTMMRAESQAIINAGLKCLEINQHVPESSEDGAVICQETEAQLKAEFLNRVSSEAPGSCVFITRTNAEVQEMNQLAHKLVTNRSHLAPGDIVLLYTSSKLGKNNTLAEIATIEPSKLGFIITTKPDGDDLGIHKVEVALPIQYESITRQIDALVKSFSSGFGNGALEAELKMLRAIVPVDFPYSITTHKSQGASIPIVFANSQKLHGRKAFYVAYSRASKQLNVCKRASKTKGVAVQGTTWVHKDGYRLDLQPGEHLDLKAVQEAIAQTYANAPSISHLACVLNPSHASKSAKGWTLT